MLIGNSVNSLGYFEENGAQNACFTISNESLNTQQNNRKFNDFNEIKHSCDNFDIATKKQFHIRPFIRLFLEDSLIHKAEK